MTWHRYDIQNKWNQHYCLSETSQMLWILGWALNSQPLSPAAGCKINKDIYIFTAYDELVTFCQFFFVRTITILQKCSSHLMTYMVYLCIALGLSFSHAHRNHHVQHCYSALEKLVDERGDEWDLYLSAVLFSLRSKKHSTTLYSPFRLLYNREAKYPSQLPDLPLDMVSIHGTKKAIWLHCCWHIMLNDEGTGCHMAPNSHKG